MYAMDISKHIAHRCDTETLAAAQLHTPGNLSCYCQEERGGGEEAGAVSTYLHLTDPLPTHLACGK